jgi:hypothetical protein
MRTKNEVLEIVSTESPCFFTHLILTRPRIPTRPATVNHSYCFLFFILFPNIRGTRLLFPFFILFSRKKKLIGVMDGVTQKEILWCSRDIDAQNKGKLIGMIDDT